MAHYSKIFNKLPIPVPNKSGFNKSFETSFTGKVGTLLPVLVDEMLPNDTIKLSNFSEINFPPMATNFYGRLDYKLEAFFVPMRLLYGGMQSFLSNLSTSEQIDPVSKFLPNFYLGEAQDIINDSTFTQFFDRGSLSDMLGFKGMPFNSRNLKINNILPYVAYHLIWQDYYRDSRLQKPAFPVSSLAENTLQKIRNYSFPVANSAEILTADGVVLDNHTQYSDIESSLRLYDGTNLFDLRQRNWARDYYTTAGTTPQQAGAAGTNVNGIHVNVDTSSGTSTFTIAQLRSANALQQWLERNNIAGNRYIDQIRARFGITPSDATFQRPVYLGSNTFNVYTRSVSQTAPSVEDVNGYATDYSSNPFKSVGSQYGQSKAVGGNSLVDKFTASEHGYIFVIGSLVPHATYSTGTRRYLNRSTLGDFLDPAFAGIGEQAIKSTELYTGANPNSIFGYTDYGAEHKYHDDEVHGELVDRQSLQAFQLQRAFDNTVSINSSFLEIPKDYLSQVKAYSTSSGMDINRTVYDLDYFGNIFFDYKLSSTLPVYSIPTLENLKNTHTETVARGGQRL